MMPMPTASNPTVSGRDFAATDCNEHSLTAPHMQWASGRHEDRIALELFVRTLPQDNLFLLGAGLADCLDFLERFRFTEEELAVLAAQRAVEGDPSSGPLYRPAFIDYLRELRFTGEVYAVPEGTVVGAQVPLLRVTAPRIQVTLVESSLVAVVDHATAVATKAARIALAAGDRPVWDGSLRRNTSGAAAGVTVARAAYIAGLAGTATVRARVKLGIPTTGTMAHAEVQSWGEDAEQACFENWLTRNPRRGVLLVDTYDTRRGVQRAIAASKATGVSVNAIRIDSGNLAALCRWARARLDAAGMRMTAIMVSGDLDEHKIDGLIAAGVPADVFLVGTTLANPGAAGVVYKVSEQPTLDGERILAEGNGMLERVMARGTIIAPGPDLAAIRAHAAAELAGLPAAARRLHNPDPIPVVRTRSPLELRAALDDREAPAHLRDMAVPGAQPSAVAPPPTLPRPSLGAQLAYDRELDRMLTPYQEPNQRDYSAY